MEQMPSNRRRARVFSRPAGAKAQVADGAMHIRYHHQEGTLSIRKFGWLAALVAVAAVLGAVAYSPRPADAAIAAVTKVCATTATPGVNQCTLTVSNGGLGFVGTSTVTLTNGTGAATLASIVSATFTVSPPRMPR